MFCNSFVTVAGRARTKPRAPIFGACSARNPLLSKIKPSDDNSPYYTLTFGDCPCGGQVWRYSSLFCFLYTSMRKSQVTRVLRLAFARANCAECHAITDTVIKSPNPNAPTFASVAKTPGMTGRALAVWLQTSHPTMPNFLIAEKDRDNVAIAYIMSLQTPPAQ